MVRGRGGKKEIEKEEGGFGHGVGLGMG